MTTRLYYWFNEVDEKRPGGPWWYRDFESRATSDEFLDAMVPFLWAWARTDAEEPRPPLMKIRPPKGAEVVWVKNSGKPWPTK